MNLARERLLCIEVYKTLNSWNPCFMQELFKLRETNRNVCNKYKLNLNIPVVNQVHYDTKSLRSFEPKIWNSLPHHVKSAESWKLLRKLLIIRVACLVTVLFLVWKTFHKSLLDVYCISAFLFIIIFIYVNLYIYIYIFVYIYIYIYIYIFVFRVGKTNTRLGIWRGITILR